MPKLSVIDLGKRIRSIYPKRVLICVTAYQEPCTETMYMYWPASALFIGHLRLRFLQRREKHGILWPKEPKRSFDEGGRHGKGLVLSVL